MLALNDTRFSLTKIYTDLCECCAKPKERCLQAHKCKKSDEKRRCPLNRFATLELGHDNQSKKIGSPSEQLDTKAKEHVIKCHTTAYMRILDDTLSEAFELRKEIQVLAHSLAKEKVFFADVCML